MKKSIYLLLGFGLFLSFQSCTDSVTTEEFHYSDDEFQLLTQTLDLPAETYQYPIVTNGFSGTSTSNEIYHKATLGRVLFYDNTLSVDGTVSCASCHKQEAAFADDRKLSEGIESNVGLRNSLPLGNTIGFVRYYGTDLSVQSGFFSWDESQLTINDQSEAAIVSELEMGHNMYDLAEQINKIDYYQVLFKKVYGTQGATKANILDALTEFVNSMSSRGSKFDNGAQSTSPYQDFTNFSQSENRGKTLFNDNCGSCHGVNHNAIVLSSANNGLDIIYEDKGIGARTNNSSDNGVFKVPSLRNIDLTGPYMHDGRFETLEEVVDHYSDGIQNHNNLHPFLQEFGTSGSEPRKFNFSDQNKEDIVNYLKTLTDETFVTEVKYSDPFKS